jgi:hypothetical protein
MIDATRYAAWQHNMLSGYLWIVASIPLGGWNQQAGERLLPALLNGHGIGVADLAMLAFISFPAVFWWIAYRHRNVWFAGLVLMFDVVWLCMQVQSWWVPYILGTPSAWQVRYAQGPTTKVLPSFGSHLAPDGMHFAIHVLLVGAAVAGAFGVRQLARERALGQIAR